MKFNHLNVPTHWQNYWTRYPEGHTILEALISWVSQVDSMVDNQNTLNDNVKQFRKEIDAFIERFDDQLKDEVTQTLTDWQNSGFINVVISEALQWQLDDYIGTNEDDKTAIRNQLKQLHINVLEHGLKNDGVTDNSPLLEQLLLSFKNAVFFFPNGVYRFGRPVNGVKNEYYNFHGEVTTDSSYSIARGVIETITLVGQSKQNTIFISDGDHPIFKPKAEQPLKPLNYEIENIRFVGNDKQNTPFEINNGDINIIYLRIDNCDFNNWHTGFKYDFRGVPNATNFNSMAYFNGCDFGGNLYGAYVTGDNSTLNECFIRNNDIGGLTVGGAQINVRGGKTEYNGRTNGIYKPFQIRILSNANSVNFDGLYIEPKTSNVVAQNNDDALIVFEYNTENYSYVSNITFNDCRVNGLRVGMLAEVLDPLYIRGLAFNNCQIFGLKLKYNELIYVSATGVTLKDISMNKGTIYDIQNSLGVATKEQDIVLCSYTMINPEFNTNKTPFLSSEIRHNGVNMEKVIGSVGATGTKYYGADSYSISKEATGTYLVTLYKENKGLATGNSDYFPVIVTPRYVSGARRIASIEMVSNKSFRVHMVSDTGNYFDTGFSFEATIIV